MDSSSLIVEVAADIPLQAPAAEFRSNALLAFSPEHSRGEAILAQASRLVFNGDWRTHQHMIHRCCACCASAAESRAKMKVWLTKILKALRLRLVNKGNWLGWQRSVPLVGVLMACHRMFVPAFRSAIAKMPLKAPDPTVADESGQATLDSDKVAQMRVQLSDILGVRSAMGKDNVIL